MIIEIVNADSSDEYISVELSSSDIDELDYHDDCVIVYDAII